MYIREFFKYSWFADLAYVDWRSMSYGDKPDPEFPIRDAHDSVRVPGVRNDQNDRTLGDKIFLRPEDTANVSEGWKVADFRPTDSDTGFAASLFTNEYTNEKVLGIRGTDVSDLQKDLIEADLQQIGGLGLALSQAVSLFNYVQAFRPNVVRARLPGRT